VKTVSTLEKAGYTGRVYIVIDDQDKQRAEYYATYGDKVVEFSKEEAQGTFDIGDNRTEKNVVVFARNACWAIAKKLGLKYFVQLDDDYVEFWYTFNGRMYPKCVAVKTTFDQMLQALLDFYKRVTNLMTLATAQGGDFIGGDRDTTYLKRKAMNLFLCDVDRPFQFVGRVNEDVNAYVLAATRGELMFTTMAVQLNQVQTQQSKGGLTEEYLASGTYVKSFYSVMMAPSCVKISDMGRYERRIHHKVKWNNAAPKILRCSTNV
jgi:hypothetical protein